MQPIKRLLWPSDSAGLRRSSTCAHQNHSARRSHLGRTRRLPGLYHMCGTNGREEGAPVHTGRAELRRYAGRASAAAPWRRPPVQLPAKPCDLPPRPVTNTIHWRRRKGEWLVQTRGGTLRRPDTCPASVEHTRARSALCASGQTAAHHACAYEEKLTVSRSSSCASGSRRARRPTRDADCPSPGGPHTAGSRKFRSSHT